MFICIAAVGAAVLNVINAPGDPIAFNARILLSASVSISLLSISFIHKTIQIPEQYQKIHKLPGRTISFAALLVLIPGLFEMGTILFLSITIIIILAPILFSVRLWVKEQVNDT